MDGSTIGIDVRFCAGNVKKLRGSVSKTLPAEPLYAAAAVRATRIWSLHGLFSAHRPCEEASFVRKPLDLDDAWDSTGSVACALDACDQTEDFWPVPAPSAAGILATGRDGAGGSPCPALHA